MTTDFGGTLSVISLASRFGWPNGSGATDGGLSNALITGDIRAGVHAQVLFPAVIGE